MPKVSVYLPDELYRRAKEKDLPISTLTQEAIERALQDVRRAYDLRDRIQVCDGLYVALAEELRCPLVTTDRRLAVAAPPCEIRIPPGDPNAGAVPPPPRHP